MKGSIYKSTSRVGRTTWRYQIDAGRDENGHRIRPRAIRFPPRAGSYRGHAREDAGPEARTRNTVSTLSEYLEQWLPYHTNAKPLSPTTASRYSSLAVHVTRTLGSVPLQDLTVFMLDNLYVKLCKR